MAIKIKFGQATIETESQEELKTVLSTLGLMNGMTVEPPKKRDEQPEEEPDTHGPVSIGERLAELVKAVSPEQKKFLMVLKEAPGTLNDLEVCERLGIPRPKLGGILKGLSRRTDAAGIKSSKYIMRKDVFFRMEGPYTRGYEFHLKPEMRAVLSAL